MKHIRTPIKTYYAEFSKCEDNGLRDAKGYRIRTEEQAFEIVKAVSLYDDLVKSLEDLLRVMDEKKTNVDRRSCVERANVVLRMVKKEGRFWWML